MFSIDDYVVCHNRVCKITRVRESYFEGKDYYELQVLYEKSLKLFIAIDEAKPPVMRSVLTKAEAMALIDSAIDIEPVADPSLKQPQGASMATVAERMLKEEYGRLMKDCNPYDLIAIIKSAYGRAQDREDEGKRPTVVDKKFLELADSLLCNELSISLGMDREKIPAYLQRRIGRSS